jgi:hypothetical protein
MVSGISRQRILQRKGNFSAANKAVTVSSSQERKFIPPRRPSGNFTQGQLVLPGSLVSLRNKYNFIANVRTVLEKKPVGIEVEIYFQPSRNNSSILVSLNFNDHFQAVHEINPSSKEFILVVRVKGQCAREKLNKVLKVFTAVLSDHKFLRADPEAVQEKAGLYLKDLAHIKAIKWSVGHYHGGRRSAKDVAADENSRGEDNNETTDPGGPDNEEAKAEVLLKTLIKKKQGFFKTGDGDAGNQADELS